MPKVSVVIPIYGVENYIERCAKSLFEQTLDDIEYIFVDDNSPDNSLTVLKNTIKQYPAREHQVKILSHENNKGLPYARRTGIEQACGDYIIHCDSDDWVDSDMYRAMYSKAQEDDADIVVCDYFITDGIGNNQIVGACLSTKKKDFIENLFLNSKSNSWAVWNKLYKRSLYTENNLIDPLGAMGEDMLLSFQLVWYSKRISYINKAFYYYFFNPNSISNNLAIESCLRKFYQLKDNVDLVQYFFSDKILTSKMKTGLMLLKYEARSMLYNVIGDKKYYVLWKATYPDLFFPLLLNPRVSLKIKSIFLLTYLKMYPRKKFRVI